MDDDGSAVCADGMGNSECDSVGEGGVAGYASRSTAAERVSNRGEGVGVTVGVVSVGVLQMQEAISML